MDIDNEILTAEDAAKALNEELLQVVSWCHNGDIPNENGQASSSDPYGYEIPLKSLIDAMPALYPDKAHFAKRDQALERWMKARDAEGTAKVDKRSQAPEPQKPPISFDLDDEDGWDLSDPYQPKMPPFGGTSGVKNMATTMRRYGVDHVVKAGAYFGASRVAGQKGQEKIAKALRQSAETELVLAGYTAAKEVVKTVRGRSL